MGDQPVRGRDSPRITIRLDDEERRRAEILSQTHGSIATVLRKGLALLWQEEQTSHGT